MTASSRKNTAAATGEEEEAHIAAKEVDQTRPIEPSPGDETHDGDAYPIESRPSPTAMEIHTAAAIMEMSVGELNMPADSSPTGLEMTSVGQGTTSTVPAILFPLSSSNPVAHEVGKTKEALAQALSLETRLKKYKELTDDLHKDASELRSNIHINTRVSTSHFPQSALVLRPIETKI